MYIYNLCILDIISRVSAPMRQKRIFISVGFQWVLSFSNKTLRRHPDSNLALNVICLSLYTRVVYCILGTYTVCTVENKIKMPT